MNDELIERLRLSDPDCCWPCGEWGCKVPPPCRCECHSWAPLMAEAADEIQRLRALITAWVDACMLMEKSGSLDTSTPEGCAAGEALFALRRAVGR